MAQVLNQKVGDYTLKDALIVAGAKIVSEQAFILAGLGNSNPKSAVAKGITAYIVYKASKKKLSTLIATGVAIDGLEDAIYAAKKYVMLGIRNPLAKNEW